MKRYNCVCGRQLYERFYGFAPDRTEMHRFNRIIPPIVVELGELCGIIYRTNKWDPKNVRTYIHFMEDPPKLVSDTAGTQLYIIGGSYRITEKGIEG